MEEQGVNKTVSFHVGNKCQMLRTMVLDNQSIKQFNKERSGQWWNATYNGIRQSINKTIQ